MQARHKACGKYCAVPHWVVGGAEDARTPWRRVQYFPVYKLLRLQNYYCYTSSSSSYVPRALHTINLLVRDKRTDCTGARIPAR